MYSLTAQSDKIQSWTGKNLTCPAEPMRFAFLTFVSRKAVRKIKPNADNYPRVSDSNGPIAIYTTMGDSELRNYDVDAQSIDYPSAESNSDLCDCPVAIRGVNGALAFPAVLDDSSDSDLLHQTTDQAPLLVNQKTSTSQQKRRRGSEDSSPPTPRATHKAKTDLSRSTAQSSDEDGSLSASTALSPAQQNGNLKKRPSNDVTARSEILDSDSSCRWTLRIPTAIAQDSQANSRSLNIPLGTTVAALPGPSYNAPGSLTMARRAATVKASSSSSPLIPSVSSVLDCAPRPVLQPSHELDRSAAAANSSRTNFRGSTGSTSGRVGSGDAARESVASLLPGSLVILFNGDSALLPAGVSPLLLNLAPLPKPVRVISMIDLTLSDDEDSVTGRPTSERFTSPISAPTQPHQQPASTIPAAMTSLQKSLQEQIRLADEILASLHEETAEPNLDLQDARTALATKKNANSCGASTSNLKRRVERFKAARAD